MNKTTKNELHLNSIVELSRDLASELDLHYEDSDLFALGPSMEILHRACCILTDEGLEIPDVVKSLTARYQRRYN